MKKIIILVLVLCVFSFLFETVIATDFTESCTMSDSTYQCKLHSTYCVTGDPEVCLSDKCDVAACPARDHATNTGNNCDLSPGDGFACICFEGYCTGATGSCTVSGTCNYDCNSGWYNDDGNSTNGCENQPPKWIVDANSNATGFVVTGTGIMMYSQWADTVGAELSKFIFSWNASGTDCDTWVNESYSFLTGNWTNATKTVPNSCSGKIIGFKFYVNDTANRWNVTSIQTFSMSSGWLNVTLNEPDPSVYNNSNSRKWYQNNTYTVSANITCMNGDCGNVYGTIRYNASSANPDTAINTTKGATPLYIIPMATTETVNSTGDAGAYSSIAIDDNGTVHISYESGSDLVHCNNSARTWGCEIVEVHDALSSYGFYSSIAIDSQNHVHISHTKYNTEPRYCNNTLGTWTCRKIGTGNSIYTSIAVDSNDKVHISYMNESDFNLYYCNNTGGTWTCTKIETGNVWWYSSIAIDSNDNVHISHMSNAEGDLRYCNNTGGTWTCTNVETNGLVGYYPSIAIDSNDKVHISHYNTDTDDLRYCNNTAGTWACTNVETGGNVGSYSSIAIDSNDKVHIVHENLTDKTIRYCYTNDFSTWECQKVDDVGITIDTYGRSIAIKKGRLSTSNSFSPDVHISYKNTTTDDLMHAKVTRNLQSCGSLSEDQTCQLNWTINATGGLYTYWKIGVLFNSSSSGVAENHTNNATIKITWPYISVTLTVPTPNIITEVVQNTTFNVNATVTCRDGPCGNVNGTVRYNASSANPDTAINTTKGDKPFYNTSGSNPQSCGTLNDGNSYQLNLTVNATGVVGTHWKIDVNFTSSFSNVSSKDTNNAIIEIILMPNVIIHGIALYYYTGERVNGNVLAIPLEDPDERETGTVSNGEWSLDFRMDTGNMEQLTIIVDDDEKIGYNELKLNDITASLNCSTQDISLSGYSVDINSGNTITSGNVKVSILDTDYINTTTFTGTWSVDFHPCLISGKVYTLQVLISDNTGKRGEFLQKYPAR